MDAQLFAAIEAGNLGAVRALLEKGVSPLVRGATGETPLMRACERPVLAVVRALLEHRADVGVADESGRTALHVAAEQLHTGEGVAVLSALLDRCRPEMLLAKDSHKRTALHCLAADCRNRGATEVLHRFIGKATPQLLQERDDRGESVIEHAINRSHVTTCAAMLQHLQTVEPVLLLDALAVFTPEWAPTCLAMAQKLQPSALVQDAATAIALLEALCPDQVLLHCGVEIITSVLGKLSAAELHGLLRQQLQMGDLPLIQYALAYNNYPYALALIEALPASSSVLQAAVRPELAVKYPDLVGKTALQMAAELAEMVVELEKIRASLSPSTVAQATEALRQLGFTNHGLAASFVRATGEFDLSCNAASGRERTFDEIRGFVFSLIGFVQTHHAVLVKAILFRVAPAPSASPIELPTPSKLPAPAPAKAQPKARTPSPAIPKVRSQSPQPPPYGGEEPPVVRLTRPALDQMVDRLYQQSMAQKKEKQERQEAALYQYAEPQTLPPTKVQELAKRLCDESMEKHQQSRKLLKDMHHAPQPTKTLAPDQLFDVVGRLYAAPVQHRREQLEKLEQQYAFKRNTSTISPAQVQSAVARLYQPRPDAKKNEHPLYYATHGM